MKLVASTLNCKGKLIDLSEPRVMGILNMTPDSFYGGSRYHQIDAACQQVELMLQAGATFLDIGGMSTRPGSVAVSEDEELRRTVPVIEQIASRFPTALISLDTYRSRVAAEGIAAGACLINDISGGQFDPEIWKVAAAARVPYVLMHTSGLPDEMQHKTEYAGGVVQEVLDYFIRQVGQLRALGVVDIVLDPGFGFGKSLRSNYQLLDSLSAFQLLGRPILVGISRKSMVYKVLDGTPETALAGTTALHMTALDQGAAILRVHDVQAAIDAIKVWQMRKVCRI